MTRVLLVGVGGLGAPVALALARSGAVHVLGLADDDVVERTNLHRQILFCDEDAVARRPKLDAARAALARESPELDVVVHASRFLPANAVELASQYDLVVEGSDNFATKFLAADACYAARRPLIHGAAVRWIGTALAVAAGGRPCYRCLFECEPIGADAPNCADAGVMGPVVGVVGALQADLALAVLAGRDVAGTLVTFDGRTERVRRRRIVPRASCILCSAPSDLVPPRTNSNQQRV